MKIDFSYNFEKETSTNIFVNSSIFYSWAVARNLEWRSAASKI